MAGIHFDVEGFGHVSFATSILVEGATAKVNPRGDGFTMNFYSPTSNSSRAQGDPELTSQYDGSDIRQLVVECRETTITSYLDNKGDLITVPRFKVNLRRESYNTGSGASSNLVPIRVNVGRSGENDQGTTETGHTVYVYDLGYFQWWINHTLTEMGIADGVDLQPDRAMTRDPTSNRTWQMNAFFPGPNTAAYSAQ